MAENFYQIVNGQLREEPPQDKYFLISKGFVFGSISLVFAIAILGAEIRGVDAWILANWHQWIKVVGAGFGSGAAAISLYGRCVATAPIRFR